MEGFVHVDRDKQLLRAVEIFEKARSRSPFYSSKYKGVEKPVDYNGWLKIPFLERDELRTHTFPYSKEMLTTEVEDMIVISTGGTSGVARYTVFTHSEWESFSGIQAKALHLLGVGRRDIVANLFVAGNLWPSFLGAHEILKKIGAVHLPIMALQDIERIVELLELFKPTVIFTLPTLMVFIVDKLLEKGIALEGVRMILYGGEQLSESSMNHIRKVFKDAHIKALGYSSADCGLMGYQCDKCAPNEYHIPTEFQFLEVYDFERDRACLPEEQGEIIVTNLARTSLPIIRYRLGDVGYIKKESCACGDSNPILVFGGRAGDDFKLGGAYFPMNDIEKALSGFVSVDGISPNFALELEDVENKVKFELKIESYDINSSKRHVNDIIKSVKEHLPVLKTEAAERYVKVLVSFVPIGSLPRSPITGKVRRLIDKRLDKR